MLTELIGLEAGERIVDFVAFFRHGWPLLLLGALGAVAYSVYLYGREHGLSKGSRIFMGSCQALAVTLMAAILLEPVLDVHIVKPMRRTILVLLDTSTSMAIRDIRSRAADIEEAARLTGAIGLTDSLEAQSGGAVAEGQVARSRLELAQLALSNPGMPWVTTLSEEYDVRFFSFDGTLHPASGEAGAAGWIGGHLADGESSRVGSAIDEAVARHAGQPLSGVVVLSDFAWFDGLDPADVARDLKTRGIPVHPVGIGVSSQPDFSIRRIIAPDVVFADDRIPLRIQIDSSGFDGKTGALALSADGESFASQDVQFSDGTQFAEILFTPSRKSGTVELDVVVSGPADEISDANNRASHTIRILDEKIKVLYVEAMPRWEYRYLRWVLLRDPRLDVHFLMTEGDPALATTTPRHLAKFPEDPAEIMKYDLVILGDVPAAKFNRAQLDRMEELVRQGGGSLLMLAGPVAAPSSYSDTPIAKLLPVKFFNEPWRTVADDRYPVATPEGQDSPCVSLLGSPEANARLWAKVCPMSHVPPLDGAKPGATTLLTLSGEIEGTRVYPLVAWQRYGNGKVMFVGSEDLWRLRREDGSTYHARFWGQTIQFLALSRLLGANKQIALETDRRLYGAGEQVRIYANVLNETFAPIVEPAYRVLLEKEGQMQTPMEIELEPLPNTPGLYSGLYLATEDGTFAVKTISAQRDVSNVAAFDVKTTPLEQRETDMQANVVRQLAELSGGKAYRLSELGDLPDDLRGDEELTQSIHRERDLWDLPLLFVVMVILTGAEWFVRRRDNLV